jgi:undecaprenyl phosphate-alpha-L-ara4N flippase subunit ArnE
MSATLAPAALGLLVFCIACETVQQLGFKAGADRAGAAANRVRGVLLQPLIWLGVALWVIESVAWLLVLQQTPLSVAYPVMTLSYAVVPLASVLVLRERLSRRQLAGGTLIFAGVVCVGLSGAAG